LLLDRDGVVNAEIHRLHRPEDVVILAGVAELIAQANARGVPVVVVTNQAGVGLGLYDEAAVRAVHARIAELLAPAQVDGWFHCPHVPEDRCACRKPAPGLLLTAAAALDLDLSRSVLVGDKRSDLEAARAVGARSVLVRTGHGAVEAEALEAAGATHLFDRRLDSLRGAWVELASLLGGDP
jgi:D-glycero-D-manno-heptose 1,7-bisphosphate phosphatase